MQRKSQIRVTDLSRFLIYILAHRPDEFGLVPDSIGFITMKELLRAIHEEPGWGYVREGHIREVLIGKDRALFAWEEDRIRAVEKRWHLDLQTPSENTPKDPVCRHQEKGPRSRHGKRAFLRQTTCAITGPRHGSQDRAAAGSKADLAGGDDRACSAARGFFPCVR